MPLTYEIDSQTSVVEISFGAAPMRRWGPAIRRVLTDPRFVPHASFLVDCRATSRAPSADEVRAAVDYLARNASLVGRSHWAVVVLAPSRFGMARLASALPNGPDLRLRGFTDIDDARAWLGADPRRAYEPVGERAYRSNTGAPVARLVPALTGR